MAIRTKKYISRGARKVKGIKVTEKNYQEVFAWAQRNAKNVVHREQNDRNEATADLKVGGDLTDQRFYLHLRGLGIRVARIGDFVGFEINHDSGLVDDRVFIVKGDIFLKKQYKEFK